MPIARMLGLPCYLVLSNQETTGIEAQEKADLPWSNS